MTSSRPWPRPASRTLINLAAAQALLGLALTTAAPHARAQAPAALQSTAARDWQLPAGPLGRALAGFAAEAGIALSFDPALTEGRSAAALQGRFAPRDALTRLLAGSGLEAVARTDGSYTLRPASAPAGTAVPAPAPAPAPASTTATLAPVTVVADHQRELTEGTGSYTTRSTSTATRLNLSLRETPQSVSVMTRQQIEDQGIQSVEDVALQVTGLTLTRGAPERTQLRSRGFNIDTVMVDGVPMTQNSDMTGPNTLAMYDHVEVLRGAAGLMQGTGNPSATINLIRKRPTDQTQVNLSGSVGTWNNVRTELDAGGALNEAKTLRGRAVVAYQNTDSFRDHYDNNRRLFYGTLEADLGARTTLSVGAAYNEEINNGSAWYGVPTFRDGSFLPIRRSANYTPPWAYWNKQNERVFADLEHGWDNGWKAKLSVHASNANMDALYNNMVRAASGENLSYSFVGDSDYAQRMRGIDVHASGPFALLGRTHELVMGATHRRLFQRSAGLRADGYSFAFDPTQPWQAQNAPVPVLGPRWGDQRDRTEQSGAYATSRLNLADPLKLILGARLDWYDAETRYYHGSSAPSGFAVDRKFTPYAGLVYDLNDTYSVYGSWTRLFQPQSSRDRSGAILPPVTGTNYETGIKGEYLNGALNASLAAFKVVQANLAKSLSSNECAPGITSCAEAAGEVESKGLEFELSGQLTADWKLTAGYTFATAKYTQATSSAAAGTRFATDQPRHLFKLFTTYRLPGALNAWRVGGGVRQQSAIYKDTGSVRIRQGGYAVVDLMLAWQASPNLDLRLNVSNLFDKYYYESIGSPTNGNGFGAPRNVLLTANYRF